MILAEHMEFLANVDAKRNKEKNTLGVLALNKMTRHFQNVIIYCVQIYIKIGYTERKLAIFELPFGNLDFKIIPFY